MQQIALRTIIVVLAGVFLMLIVPLLLSFIGITIGADAMQLIKICLAVIAIYYIFWGPVVTRPTLQ